MSKELLNTIKQGKTRYIGHIMRGRENELLKLIIKGKIKEEDLLEDVRTSGWKTLENGFGALWLKYWELLCPGQC